MKKTKLVVFVLPLILLLSNAGCFQKVNETSSIITISPSETPPATETATILKNSTLTWTPSPTSPPLTVTPSKMPSTITPTITHTSLPTLSRGERQTYITEHLSDNSNCKLPCWLGITPGISSWQETRAFLDYLGLYNIRERYMEDGMISYDSGELSFEKPIIHLLVRILKQNDLVKGIYLNVEGYNAPNEFQEVWKLYSPKNIMREYGFPSRAWLSTESGDYGDRHPYDLIIAYDKRGIIIHYRGWLSRAGSTFRMCPRYEKGMDIQLMDIFLQSPNDPMPLENLGGLRDLVMINKNSKRIQEASGLTEEEFSKLFIQNEKTACFNSPVNIWPEFFTP